MRERPAWLARRWTPVTPASRRSPPTLSALSAEPSPRWQTTSNQGNAFPASWRRPGDPARKGQAEDPRPRHQSSARRACVRPPGRPCSVVRGWRHSGVYLRSLVHHRRRWGVEATARSTRKLNQKPRRPPASRQARASAGRPGGSRSAYSACPGRHGRPRGRARDCSGSAD